jgi:hypothetical protein
MHQTFHRKIRLVAGEGQAHGDLADDAHHFRVRITHDGERVTSVEGEAVRYPWTTCPEATGPLRAVEGMPLSTDCAAIGAHAPARANCTHLFDLAGFVVAHASSGREERLYHCVVDGPPDEPSHATLERDGEVLFDLTVRPRDGAPHLYGAAPFDGISIYGGFLQWARQHFDPEAAEAAIMMRRAIMIAGVRHFDLDKLDRASEAQGVRGQCYTYREGIAERAVRVVGSRRDFATSHESMLDPDTWP